MANFSSVCTGDSFLEFAALQRGRCVLTYIHPNVSTQGPPTSSVVQVNLGNFLSGFFTGKFPANRVRGATTSGSVNILSHISGFPVNRLTEFLDAVGNKIFRRSYVLPI